MTDEIPNQTLTLTGCLWRVGLGLFVLAIVLGGGGLFYVSREYHRNRTALQVEVQRIRNLGEPLGSAELAAYASIPVGETDITQRYVSALQSLLGERFARLKTAADKTADGIDLDAIPLRPSSWLELEEIEAYLAPYASPLDDLTAAAKLSGSVRYSADFSLHATRYDMPEIVHRACDLLFLRSACQYHRGDFEAATDTIVAIIRLGDTLRLDPTLISQLIRQSAYEMAMSTLVHLSTDPEFPAASIARIQKVLEIENFDRAFYRAAIGERSFAFDVIQSPYNEFVELTGGRKASGKATVAEVRPGDSAMLLRLRSLHVETGKLPWHQAIAANEAARQAIDAEEAANAKRFSWDRNGVTDVAGAMGSSFFDTMLRCECERRAAITICAIERYRRERGQLPDALQSLVPDYLAEVPLDPVNQKPMTFTSTGSAYKVYSLGADQQDDGGSLGNSRGATDYGWQAPRAPQAMLSSP